MHVDRDLDAWMYCVKSALRGYVFIEEVRQRASDRNEWRVIVIGCVLIQARRDTTRIAGLL